MRAHSHLSLVLLLIVSACGPATGPATDAGPAVDGSGPGGDGGLVRTLAIVKAGDGNGTVTSIPAGIFCGSDCSGEFAAGTSVLLQPTAEAGSSFIGWSGGGCSGSAPCMVTVDSDLSIEAEFVAGNAVTVTIAGSGGGNVVSAPVGINCPGDCSEVYTLGQQVTLTATPTSGSEFVGWSGACTGTGDCVVTASAGVAVTATFDLQPLPLSVTLSGNGTGSVTSVPDGIDCGSACSALYSPGTMVTLTAAAGTGSTFTGWTGEGCSGVSTCVVTVAAAASVIATFTLDQHIVTVAKLGTGTGTVASSPVGISCGADCSQAYNYGTTVTLTATAAGGSSFSGWSGPCTGTSPCVLSVTAPQTVNATFVPGGLTCTSVSTANTCSNGAVPEINLGAISSASCRTQCQTSLANAGVNSGCWILALNNNCYCRSGSLVLGGNRPGGVCN